MFKIGGKAKPAAGALESAEGHDLLDLKQND